MGVVDGTPVDAATTNPAFIDANQDDFTIGILGLQKTDGISGPFITNTQRELNSLNSYTGSSPNQPSTNVPTYTNNNGFTTNQNLKDRTDSLSLKFDQGLGHTHTGAPGDGPPIPSTSVSTVQLRGYFSQGVDITGANGLSTDVSSLLSSKTPSTNSTTKGVVVSIPNNRIILRHATGSSSDDKIIDSSGNEVYGRLTYLSSVWTLSYYVEISSTETAYNLPSTDVRWYFQELFNPIVDAPTYSELAFIPSENVVADIPYASSTQEGKVLLANTAPPAIGSTSSVGTSTRVSLQDHTHEGVHSISASGNPEILGDVVLASGTNTSLTQVGNTITINASSSGVNRSINNINTTTTLGSTALTDYVYNVSGTTTVTMPTAVGNTNEYKIKNVGTGTVTINTTLSQTIDGSASITMAVQYTSLTLISDGTNWGIY